MSPASTQSACRTCGNPRLSLGLDLGLLTLANSFLPPHRAFDATPEPRYPLRVFYCEYCALIQLRDIVDMREMYDDYAFLTATATTSLIHFDQYAEDMTRRLSLKSADLVVDIGSNDGTLLKAFRRRDTTVLGVEPARNLANQAMAEGVPTLNEYFGPDTVERIGPHGARLITANNVVSHVQDLNGFMESVSNTLASEGIFAFEVPWVVDVLRNSNFNIIINKNFSTLGLNH